MTRAPGENQQTTAAPLLMEFFPPGIFIPDQEFAVRSLGMHYVGWWNERYEAANPFMTHILNSV